MRAVGSTKGTSDNSTWLEGTFTILQMHSLLERTVVTSISFSDCGRGSIQRIKIAIQQNKSITFGTMANKKNNLDLLFTQFFPNETRGWVFSPFYIERIHGFFKRKVASRCFNTENVPNLWTCRNEHRFLREKSKVVKFQNPGETTSWGW